MATKDLDFARLSLRDALDFAILVEEEARERYEEFAQQMESHHTPLAARFFAFMARNEEKHRAELAGRRTALFGQAPSTVRREMLFDVEAPEYAEARVFMTAHDALTTALRSEEKAWTFFSQALPSIKQPEVKALFEELLQEEVEHQVLVKVELSKLPPEDSYKQEDFEDDPVGHD